MGEVWKGVALACLFLVGSADAALAQEKRVALVIGNSKYAKAAELYSTANDARKVAEKLKAAKYTLIGGGPQLDLTRQKFQDALRNLALEARGAEVALIYYAGYGLEVNEVNYLVPVDADPPTPGTMDTQMLDVTTKIVQPIKRAGPKLTVILLDASRDNPFLAGDGGPAGLAAMEVEEPATFIHFAAEPKKKVLDGLRGQNSPYALALAKILERSLPTHDFFDEVDDAVKQETGRRPWSWKWRIPDVRIIPPPRVAIAPPPKPPVDVAPRKDPKLPEPPVTAIVPGPPVRDLVVDSYKEVVPLLEKKDYAGARAKLQVAMIAEPSSTRLQRTMGFTYLLEHAGSNNADVALSAYKEGFVYLDEAINRDDKDGTAWRFRGNMILATYWARRQKNQQFPNLIDDAIRNLRAATALDPKSYRSATALGMAYILKGKYSDAIDLFNKAIQENKTYAAASARCMAHRLAGNQRLAREDATAAQGRDRRLRDPQPCLHKDMASFWAYTLPEF